MAVPRVKSATVGIGSISHCREIHPGLCLSLTSLCRLDGNEATRHTDEGVEMAVVLLWKCLIQIFLSPGSSQIGLQTHVSVLVWE